MQCKGPCCNKPDGHRCPWSPKPAGGPPYKKTGYSHPYSADSNNNTEKTAKTANVDELHECKGVCYSGVCALEWNGPLCCLVPHPETHDYNHRHTNPYAAGGGGGGGREATTANADNSWHEDGGVYCRN